MIHKIRWRLFAYFAGALLVFSIIAGLMFSVLFSRHTMNIYKTEMEIKATTISKTLAGFMEGSSQGQGHGQGRQGGYGAYMRFIEDIAMTDVWIVDKNMNQITRGHGMVSLSFSDLPEDAESVISKAFDGDISFSENFTPIRGQSSVSVAKPIITEGGSIEGVVLLHSNISDISAITNSGLLILLFSMSAAVIISFFIAGMLSSRFTKPLEQMRTVAQQVSSGDFSVKTNVNLKDEIGELASALDDMTVQLDVAAKESDKLNKMRYDFVSNVSHELRTPVTVLKGSLEALCDKVVSEPKKVEQYHQQMLRESIHLEHLVCDLLELSRLQNPDFSMQVEAVNMKEITLDAVHSIERIAMVRDIGINFQCSGDVSPIVGDYGRLRQMIIIVLDNAVKFSFDSSTVQVRLDNVKGGLILTISDNGCGIPPEDLPHIFERFYKQRSEENKSGSGLGMSIAKQIADRHNISMSIKNNRNNGVTVQFIISIQGNK